MQTLEYDTGTRVSNNSEHICVPELSAVGQDCHALDLTNILELGDTGTK